MEAGAVAVVLSYPLITIWRAYVLTVLWAWFVVPFGVVEIGLIPAMGVFLIVFLLRYDVGPNKDRTNAEYWEIFAQAVFLPAFILGVGYIIHLFQ